MQDFALATGVAAFYLFLLAGALVRVRRHRSCNSFMQLLGILIPIVPAAVLLLAPRFVPDGLSPALRASCLAVYAGAWLMMAAGYLLEGLAQRPAGLEASASDGSTGKSDGE